MAIILSACGFSPLYGEHSQSASVVSQLALIKVPPINDRTGQLVRIELTDRLTPTQAGSPAAYLLPVTLTETRQNLAVRKDATATRANLVIRAAFRLLRISDGVELTSGIIRSVNSYDIVDSNYATLAAESDARRRGAKDVADGIVNRLAIFIFSSQHPRSSGQTR
jgi:LPS-assembly lipoprotein